MLATIGDEMHWDSTGGIVQTQGSEGCILHGSGRYVRPPDGLGLRQSPNAWFRHENGRFSNGLMAVNIALSDVAPGDGGFCVVPGSACHPLPGASVHLHVTRKSVRWNHLNGTTERTFISAHLRLALLQATKRSWLRHWRRAVWTSTSAWRSRCL